MPLSSFSCNDRYQSWPPFCELMAVWCVITKFQFVFRMRILHSGPPKYAAVAHTVWNVAPADFFSLKSILFPFLHRNFHSKKRSIIWVQVRYIISKRFCWPGVCLDRPPGWREQLIPRANVFIVSKIFGSDTSGLLSIPAAKSENKTHLH